MKTLKLLFCALILSALSNARATSVTTDQSDLWFIPAESGWGVQVVQRDSVLFATLYVYGPSGSPTWYVATMDHSGSLLWSGALYATTGPYFGSLPFNPAAVNATQVGTMTWSAPLVGSATVTYSVNGVVVTKNVIRETLVGENYNGTFPGAIHLNVASCTNPAGNLTVEEVAALIVTQSGSNVTLAYGNEGGAGCSFSGTLVQSGQFGTMSGNYTCTAGEFGTFDLFELNVGFNYLTGRVSTKGTNTGCQTTGYFAGIRHR